MANVTSISSGSKHENLSLTQIRIHPKIKEFLLPHSESEAAMLEEDILFEGRLTK
jgi:hypothetical protein